MNKFDKEKQEEITVLEIITDNFSEKIFGNFMQIRLLPIEQNVAQETHKLCQRLFDHCKRRLTNLCMA